MLPGLPATGIDSSLLVSTAAGGFDRPHYCCAWPSGEVGAMGLEGAVKLGHRDRLAAISDPAEREAEFTRRCFEHALQRDVRIARIEALHDAQAESLAAMSKARLDKARERAHEHLVEVAANAASSSAPALLGRR